MKLGSVVGSSDGDEVTDSVLGVTLGSVVVIACEEGAAVDSVVGIMTGTTVGTTVLGSVVAA